MGSDTLARGNSGGRITSGRSLSFILDILCVYFALLACNPEFTAAPSKGEAVTSQATAINVATKTKSSRATEVVKSILEVH